MAGGNHPRRQFAARSVDCGGKLRAKYGAATRPAPPGTPSSASSRPPEWPARWWPPSLTPVKPGARVKTDRRDAIKAVAPSPNPVTAMQRRLLVEAAWSDSIAAGGE
jgi:hypothetical protein